MRQGIYSKQHLLQDNFKHHPCVESIENNSYEFPLQQPSKAALSPPDPAIDSAHGRTPVGVRPDSIARSTAFKSRAGGSSSNEKIQVFLLTVTIVISIFASIQ